MEQYRLIDYVTYAMIATLSSLNWLNVALMAGGILVVLIGFFRTERRYRWISLLLLIAPTCGALFVFAGWRNQRTEMWLALLLALLLYRVWDHFLGRHLPEQDSDDIKVWGQDD